MFTLASAACGAAPDLRALVLFRIMQAAAAALLTPTSLGLLRGVFPPERRGSAVPGMVLSGIGVGLVTPTLMGIGTSVLPASALSTGSAVITMVRRP